MIEFHSWHYIYLEWGKIHIRNFDEDLDEAADYRVDAKLSPEFVEALKDLIRANWGVNISTSDKEPEPVEEGTDDLKDIDDEDDEEVKKPKKRTTPSAWKKK